MVMRVPSLSWANPVVTTRSPSAAPDTRTASESSCCDTVDRPHRNRAVVIRDVDEGPVRPALDGGGRNHDRVLEGVDQELHIDELAGPELQAFIGKLGLELHRAGGLVDLVVDHHELAAVDHGAVVVAERLHAQRALRERPVDLGELLLGQGEDDCDRPDLGDDHDPRGVDRMDDVAGIDQPQSGAAGDRRDDPGVGKDRLGVLDGALVGLHLGLELGDQRLLGVVLLAGRRIGRGQLHIAFEIDAGIAEQGLVHRLLGDGLVELGAIDGGIDVGEDEILLDILAFLEVDAHQLAVDLGADGHGVERTARADAVEVDGDVILLRCGGEHRHGSVGALSPASVARSSRSLGLQGLRQVLRRKEISRAGGAGEDDEEPGKAAQPSPSGCSRRSNECWIDAVSLHARLISLSGRLAASRAPNPGFPGQTASRPGARPPERKCGPAGNRTDTLAYVWTKRTGFGRRTPPGRMAPEPHLRSALVMGRGASSPSPRLRGGRGEGALPQA